jgi:hypothetical protein
MRGSGPESTEKPYSRAFDNIVQDEDDFVGLVAYALFKRAIREEAQAGQHSNGDTRTPTATVVQTYRQAAERTLSGVIDSALEAARPELQVSATLDAIETTKSSLREHITNRTGFFSAIVSNVIAWAVTLGLTVLILFLSNKPDLAKILTGDAQNAPAEVAK